MNLRDKIYWFFKNLFWFIMLLIFIIPFMVWQALLLIYGSFITLCTPSGNRGISPPWEWWWK